MSEITVNATTELIESPDIVIYNIKYSLSRQKDLQKAIKTIVEAINDTRDVFEKNLNPIKLEVTSLNTNKNWVTKETKNEFFSKDKKYVFDGYTVDCTIIMQLALDKIKNNETDVSIIYNYVNKINSDVERNINYHFDYSDKLTKSINERLRAKLLDEAVTTAKCISNQTDLHVLSILYHIDPKMDNGLLREAAASAAKFGAPVNTAEYENVPELTNEEIKLLLTNTKIERKFKDSIVVKFEW